MIRRTLACALLAPPLALACGGGDSPFDPTGTPFVVVEPPGAERTATNRSEADETGAAEPEPPGDGELVSLEWLAGGDFPSVPSAFVSPVQNAELRAAIQGALAGQEGRFSVIVHNLADGRYASLKAGDTYYAASLFKAAVLLEAYRQRDSGELDFAKEVEVTKAAAENDLGTLEYLEIEIGDKVTIGDAVKAMIVVSDTTLGNLVLEEVGYSNVDDTLREIGASTMTVSDTELPTTAADMAALVGAIARGDGVSEASRQEMLSLMAQEWFAEGVVAGLPAGTLYAHKTGSYTDATHDVAIVEGPAGPYLIAVLSDRSSEWEPIADVSAAVWQYFAENP
ncbi:MAG: serine hydrolase [Dehalococcoidia bacterium]